MMMENVDVAIDWKGSQMIGGRRHENAGPSWQPKLALDAGDASVPCVGLSEQQKAAAGSSHDQVMTEFIRER